MTFDPARHPRLILVQVAGDVPAAFRGPQAPFEYAGGIALDGATGTDDRSMWESLAAPVPAQATSPFPRLSLMVHLSRHRLRSAAASDQGYEALALLRGLRRVEPSKSDLLDWFNNEIADPRDNNVGAAGVTVPWRILLRTVRAAVYGPALRRFKREASDERGWDVRRTRILGARLAAIEAGPASDAAAEEAATIAKALEQIYTRAALADCADQRLELLVTGDEPGDRSVMFTELLARAAADKNAPVAATAFRNNPSEVYRPIPRDAGPGLRSLVGSTLQLHRWRYLYLRPVRETGRWSRRIAIVAVIAMAATVGGLWITGTPPFSCEPPFGRSSLVRCDRLSDGSNCVDPLITDVCEVIHRQNEAIGDEAAFTVVVALPLDFEGDDPNAPGDLRNQLQGAAAAQSLVNANQSPKMRLLIVNAGSGYSDWSDTADAIIDRRSEERIVAVSSISTSYTATKSFIDRLTASGLVVMGSTITGNNMLTGTGAASSAFRVAPTNTQEAEALANFLIGRTDLCEVIVVADTDPSYDYAVSLQQSFRDRQAAECGTDGSEADLPRPFDFDGSDIDSVNAATFNQTVQHLCDEIDGDTHLFFAGLSRYALPSLIRSLGGRGAYGDCGQHRITIVTGDNASSIPADLSIASDLATGGVELFYIGLAHPEQWSGVEAQFPASSEAMRYAVENLTEQFAADGLHLENGQALMSFEACYVTGLSAQRQGAEVDAPMLAAVLRGYSAPGLSGPIAFDEQGNPIDKTQVILRATADPADPVAVVALVPGGA